jgi:HAE1 family hydrophobic/amphiphilic exporter-1
VAIFGLFSLRNLSIDLYPEMDIPYITVFTQYAGASASDIETNITKLLEDNLSTVNNLKKMTSTSSDNFSMVIDNGIRYEDNGIFLNLQLIKLAS